MTKAELLYNVWGDRVREPILLEQRNQGLLRAAGDDGVAQQVVRTVRGRGYRLVADVEERVHAVDGP